MPGKNIKIRLVISLLVCLISFSKFPQASAEPTRSPYIVNTTLDSGAGSLRQAITDANTYAGKDYIDFNIPTSDLGYNAGAGVFTISLSTILPDLTDSNGVVIDGTTQPGYVAGQKPKIIISGYGLPVPGSILTISPGSSNNTIKGLSLGGVPADILTIDGDNNLIEKNDIRYSSTGNGVTINSTATGNFIYTNHIFGNHLDGIYLDAASGNSIWNNVIGLLPDYYSPSPNDPNDGDGIQCIGCTDNEITENVISANLGSGIYFSGASGNLVQNNFIGLSTDGVDDLGNGGYGIRIENFSTANDIFGNWVSGNGWDGIRLIGTGTTLNHIEKNMIGMGMAGAVPNGQHGVGIYAGAHENYVGSLSDPSRFNFIAGNGWSGVAVDGSSPGRNYIANNYIVSNQWYGVNIVNSDNNYIGLNVINRNGLEGEHAGVQIKGSTSYSNLVSRNSISLSTGPGIELIGLANNGITAPALTSASCSMVSGSTGCPNCTVQVFSDFEDEGMTYEGQVLADPGGNFTFLGRISGPNVTATVSDGSGNTSQFSIPFMGACYWGYLPMIFK